MLKCVTQATAGWSLIPELSLAWEWNSVKSYFGVDALSNIEEYCRAQFCRRKGKHTRVSVCVICDHNAETEPSVRSIREGGHLQSAVSLLCSQKPCNGWWSHNHSCLSVRWGQQVMWLPGEVVSNDGLVLRSAEPDWSETINIVIVQCVTCTVHPN